MARAVPKEWQGSSKDALRINASQIDIMMRRCHPQGMRTTITLRDEALRLAKRMAQETGKSLGDVISDGVLAAYGERPGKAATARPEIPTSGKGGLQPGVDLDDSSALADRMDDLD